MQGIQIVRKLLFMVALLFCAKAHATTCPISSGASTATIQAAFNSCAGSTNTVTVAAGTYSITSTITIPSNGPMIVGPYCNPVASAALQTVSACTAHFVPTFNPGPILKITSPTSLTVMYIDFQQTQSIAFSIGAGQWCLNNCIIEHNSFTQ